MKWLRVALLTSTIASSVAVALPAVASTFTPPEDLGEPGRREGGGISSSLTCDWVNPSEECDAPDYFKSPSDIATESADDRRPNRGGNRRIVSRRKKGEQEGLPGSRIG